jgi:hypothetical protein
MNVFNLMKDNKKGTRKNCKREVGEKSNRSKPEGQAKGWVDVNLEGSV